jgi:hypothetical protein
MDERMDEIPEAVLVSPEHSAILKTLSPGAPLRRSRQETALKTKNGQRAGGATD